MVRVQCDHNINSVFQKIIMVIACSLQLSQWTTGLFAQGVDIRGTVADSSNGERISYATVLIVGTGKGSATNESGFYLIPNAPEGNFVIIASCIGYEKRTVNVVLRPGVPLILNFKLRAEPVKTPENIVTGTSSIEFSKAQTGLHTLDQKTMAAVPVTAMPDVFRAIQILPGIVTTNDVNTHFYARGGGGDQNLILLDGMKIYNPFHVLGIFSVFDPDIVRNAEVFTGAFPPGYGSRLSSVVSLSGRDGNVNSTVGKGEVNLLSSKLQLEGPLGDNFTWLADARKSLSNSTINQFLHKTLPISFYDAFVKMTAKVTEDRQVRYGLEAFLSGDDLRSNTPTEPDYTWRNHTIGITATGLVLDRVFIDAVAYETSFEARRNPKYSPTITPMSTSIRETGVRGNATLYLDTKDLFYFGFETSFPEIQYKLINSYGVLRQDDDSEVEFWFWLRYQTMVGPWQFDGGFHLDAVNLMKGGGIDNIQPRLSVGRQLSDNWRLRFSFGELSQNFITINNEDDVVSMFDTWIRIPEGLKPEVANHYGAGIDGNILPELSLDLQIYYKDYRSLVVYNRDKIDMFDPDYINARGGSYGAEVLLRYAIPIVDFYATYSLSKTSISSQGLRYPPSYDRRHTINALSDVHIFENFDASIRWEYGSGYPFTQSIGYYDRLPLTEFYDQNFAFQSGAPYISLGEKNSGRLPQYHRLDLGFRYRFDILCFRGKAGISIINVYDRQNILYFNRTSGQQVNMIPFLPTATFELEY